MQNIDRDFVKVENIVEKFNLLHTVPTILKGHRLTVDVSFVKNGELCSARVIKPARVEDKIRLENINCK